MKKYFWHVIFTLVVLFVLFSKPSTEKIKPVPLRDFDLTSKEEVMVNVLGEEKNRQISIEEYVVGVVASEMPASFELEALKAQAVAARTYAYFKVLDGTIEEMTDTELHQVYRDEEKLKEMWGQEYNLNMNRIKEAVYLTKGEVITHNQAVINATYFSTSNGKTENSEDTWSYEIPYLRSVDSKWDITISPKYEDHVIVSASDFKKKLMISGNIVVGSYKRTTSGRVDSVVINNKQYKSSFIRQSFNLQSTDFEIKLLNNEVMFKTKGYGHGVGMSQYGAQGMALEGCNYIEILKYFYSGVEIEKLLN